MVDEPLGDGLPAGAFLVEAAPGANDQVTSLAGKLGLSFTGLDARPEIRSAPLRRPRVGLYKAWHSRVDDQGWSLWVLEEHGFAVDTLHDADIRGGDLTRYDAIVLPNQPGQEILLGNLPGTMPAAFIGGIGAEGAAALKRFAESGGTLIAFDEATDLPIDQFGLPVRNAVADLDSQQFFIPGSLIRAVVDTGMKSVDLMNYTCDGDLFTACRDGARAAASRPFRLPSRMSTWSCATRRTIFS